MISWTQNRSQNSSLLVQNASPYIVEASNSMILSRPWCHYLQVRRQERLSLEVNQMQSCCRRIVWALHNKPMILTFVWKWELLLVMHSHRTGGPSLNNIKLKWSIQSTWSCRTNQLILVPLQRMCQSSSSPQNECAKNHVPSVLIRTVVVVVIA